MHAKLHMWRSESKTLQLFLSYLHTCYGYQTQYEASMANTFTLSHLTGLLVPMFQSNAISHPYCLSYLINCSFSFIFLQKLTGH